MFCPRRSFPRKARQLDELRTLAALAGLPDDDYLLALITEGAPHARAMARRLDRDYAYSEEI